jgi:hypothetical protein
MTNSLRFLLGLACGVGIALLPKATAHLHAAARAFHGNQAAPGSARAHTEEKFAFTANAPMDQVAPLFGADKERVWAPHWEPQFVHPLPAADREGMVFTVAHDHLRAAWVNTAFDLDFEHKTGRVQYVYMIPDLLVTVITLNLKPEANQTHVEVEYDRTALSSEADDHVRHMAKQDRESGPEWEKQINTYLGKR